MFCLRSFKCEGNITCHQFDEHKIITGGDKLRVFSIKDSSLVCTVNKHSSTITCLKFLDQLLITASSDTTIRIWTLNEKITEKIDKLVLNKSKTLAQLSRNVTLSTPTFEINPTSIRTLNSHETPIRTIDFHESVLVSGDITGIVKFWHLNTGNLLESADFSGLIDSNKNDFISFSLPAAETPDPITHLIINHEILSITRFSGNMYLYNIASIPCFNSTTQQYQALIKWCVEENFTFIEKFSLPVLKEREWTCSVKVDDWRVCIGGKFGCHVWNWREGKKIWNIKNGKVLIGDDWNERGTACVGVVFDDRYVATGQMDGSLFVFDCSPED